MRDVIHNNKDCKKIRTPLTRLMKPRAVGL